MTDQERDRFDNLMEQVIAALPDDLAVLLREVPVIVDDAPSPDLLAHLRELWQIDQSVPDSDFRLDFCGLHTGRMLTERSVEDASDLPEHIHLFRLGIIEQAGGWTIPDAEDVIFEEIAVTLLHEIGHHFGLEEDDLEELGYN